MALFCAWRYPPFSGRFQADGYFSRLDDYVERLEKNWRKLIKPEDTIVLAGDISWAMRLTDTRKDFEFLQSLPAEDHHEGNHDYWWSTVNKMNAYLKAEGFDYPAPSCTTTPTVYEGMHCGGTAAGCLMQARPTTKR